MRFVIDRSKWRCGEGGKNARGIGPTTLLNQEGFMCCLGQISLQLGVAPEKLTGGMYPSSTGESNILTEKYENGYYGDSKLSERAVTINDNANLSDEERESNLVELFKEYGHEIVFEGEYVKNEYL